uniref:RRM domain-containing protein n=1 Tax=Ditylenchus dipsaci TaxID=166011 RepID=A0A915EG31_9BILA
MSEQDLGNYFSSAGPVTNVRIMIDRETNRPKGFGFCEFADQQSAQTPSRTSTEWTSMDALCESTWPTKCVAPHRKPGLRGWSKELAVAAKLFKRYFILYKPQWSSRYVLFSADYERASG